MSNKIIKIHKKVNTKDFKHFMLTWFQSNKQVTVRSKFKSVTISLILGLVVAFIIMAITTKHNPFSVFGTMVAVALNGNMLNYTLSLTGILLISGLANAIAFKTGLFNIGVSGQMFFTGAMAVIMGLTIFKSLGVLGLVLLVWIGALMGGIIAGFIGWLKAKFNVHEVVTSILLNWGLFFLARYIIVTLGTKFPGSKVLDPSGATSVLKPEFQISNHYFGVIIFMFALVVTFIIAIVLWKSTFGHSLKMTGLSTSASKYAGLNINKQIILSMALSGVVSGVLGVMFFVVQERQIGTQYMSFSKLPSIGFEGIAIALLAFSNPFGIIPIAFIFGVLSSGAGGLVQYQIDNSFSNLIVGITMYFAAISLLFMRFKPITMVYTWIKINKRHYPKEFNQIEKRIATIKCEYQIKAIKNRETLENEINDLIKEKIRLKQKYQNSILNKKRMIIKAQIINNSIRQKSLYKELKEINQGYRNICEYRRRQINLFKIKKQQEFFSKTHSHSTYVKFRMKGGK